MIHNHFRRKVSEVTLFHTKSFLCSQHLHPVLHSVCSDHVGLQQHAGYLSGVLAMDKPKRLHCGKPTTATTHLPCDSSCCWHVSAQDRHVVECHPRASTDHWDAFGPWNHVGPLVWALREGVRHGPSSPLAASEVGPVVPKLSPYSVQLLPCWVGSGVQKHWHCIHVYKILKTIFMLFFNYN